jgi:hypothetical protein
MIVLLENYWSLVITILDQNTHVLFLLLTYNIMNFFYNKLFQTEKRTNISPEQANYDFLVPSIMNAVIKYAFTLTLFLSLL